MNFNTSFITAAILNLTKHHHMHFYDDFYGNIEHCQIYAYLLINILSMNFSIYIFRSQFERSCFEKDWVYDWTFKDLMEKRNKTIQIN